MDQENFVQGRTQREVYEPPALAEVGDFGELTSGGGHSVPDSMSGGGLHQ